ncbi:MAG: hypothetical protein ACE5OZ_15280 [Candidatus Heimdallarchaeota archaeon]
MRNTSGLQENPQYETTQELEAHKFIALLLWALQQTCLITNTFRTAGLLEQAVCGHNTLDGALGDLESFLLTLLLKDVQSKSYEQILRELATSSPASHNQPKARTKDDLELHPPIKQAKPLDAKSGQRHGKNEEPGE